MQESGKELLKFRLAEMLDEVPHGRYAQIRERLSTVAGLHPSFVRMLLSAKKSDLVNPSAERLRAVAAVMSQELGRTITVDDLYTPDTPFVIGPKLVITPEEMAARLAEGGRLTA
mgnify:CR=1 FL=1